MNAEIGTFRTRVLAGVSVLFVGLAVRSVTHRDPE